MKERNRLHCSVDSCVFNKDSCECTADSVDVSCTCSDPDCCDETECRTFKSKN